MSLSIIQKGTGSTVSGIKQSTFRLLQIPLPPLPEQHRIATVLSTLDECIEKTEALIAKLKQVKAGLMQDLLTRGIDDESRIRDEITHEFKDTAIGRVPVEWEIRKLEDEIEVFDCKHITPRYISDGYPLVRPRNVKESGLDLINVDLYPKKTTKI